MTAQDAVILSSFTALSVVQVSTGDWRMYVSSDGFRVLSATSSDQVSWSLEPGVRLSTTPNALDHSSITALGVTIGTASAQPLAMLYVGVSSTGLYSLLRATSTDGLNWSKSTTPVLQADSGRAFLGSPRPFHVSNTLMHLFYIADRDGSGSDLADMRIHLASSTDAGVTLSTDGPVLTSAQAFGVAVTTLTDGRTRLWYTAPLTGETTASQVLSAIASAASPASFLTETGVRLSTASGTAAMSPPSVLRGTDTFRWRLFTTFTRSGSTVPFTGTALTLTPVVETFSPSKALKTQSSLAYEITGEIFSSTPPAVNFTQAGSTFAATSVAFESDLRLTGFFSALNRSTGFHTVTVTNGDGGGGSLANALFIDVPPGAVTVVDNLFRPLRGGSASISVEIFEPGNVTVRLFTVTGRLVTTLFDGPMPQGTTNLTWTGRSSGGSVVASGVYLLSVEGPKLDTVQKIVVIK